MIKYFHTIFCFCAFSSALWAEDFVISYDRGIAIASVDGNFKILFSGLLQTRLLYDDDTKSRFPVFLLPKGRFDISGNVFRREIAYKLLVDYNAEKIELKDFFLDFTVVPKAFQVRVGRYKTLFARQAITSDGFYEFADRSSVLKPLSTGRDIGVLAHNGQKQHFEWGAGIFNGGLFGRAGVNFFGPGQTAEGYSEGDFTGGPIRASLALSAIKNMRPSKEIPLEVGGGFDGDVKVEGFNTGFGWFLGAGDIDQPDAGKTGGLVQAGYMIARRYQPSIRYAIADTVKQAGLSRQTQHEALGAFSVYFYEHSLKIQADGGVIHSREYEPSSGWIAGGSTLVATTKPQVRLQAQLAF
jgi:hypothetical protein